MPKYGESAVKSVERAMHKRKHGTLRSGGSGKKVTSKKQAIAIGLSEAREKGAKVPSKRSSGARASAGRSSGRSGAGRAGARKKSGTRKHPRRTNAVGKKKSARRTGRSSRTSRTSKSAR